jgi:hypothetical protein
MEVETFANFHKQNCRQKYHQNGRLALGASVISAPSLFLASRILGVLELRNLLGLRFFVFLVLGVLVPCQQINWCEGRDWPDKSGKVLFNLMDLETGGKLSGPRHNLHGFDLGFAGDRETWNVRAEPCMAQVRIWPASLADAPNLSNDASGSCT